MYVCEQWVLRSPDALRVLLLRDVALRVPPQPVHAQHVPRAARGGRAVGCAPSGARRRALGAARLRAARVSHGAAHGPRAAVSTALLRTPHCLGAASGFGSRIGPDI